MFCTPCRRIFCRDSTFASATNSQGLSTLERPEFQSYKTILSVKKKKNHLYTSNNLSKTKLCDITNIQ